MFSRAVLNHKTLAAASSTCSRLRFITPSTRNGKQRSSFHSTVPSYSNERIRQKKAVIERKGEETALMTELTDGILSDGIIATLEPRAAKVPPETTTTDGTIVHPSGFVVPSTDSFESVDQPLADTRSREKGVEREGVAFRVEEERALLDKLSEGGVDASTHRMEGKIPVEIEIDAASGEVTHASGFIPPAPASAFKHSKAKGGST